MVITPAHFKKIKKTQNNFQENQENPSRKSRILGLDNFKFVLVIFRLRDIFPISFWAIQAKGQLWHEAEG